MKPIEQPRLGFHDEQPTAPILISIRPRWVNAIEAGTKRYEFRRLFVRGPTTAFIYASSPVCVVRGVASFAQPVIAPVAEIARLAEEQRPGSGEATLRYLQGRQVGFAIPILDYRRLMRDVGLDELRRGFPGFAAPQSYLLLSRKPDLRTFLTDLRPT